MLRAVTMAHELDEATWFIEAVRIRGLGDRA